MCFIKKLLLFKTLHESCLRFCAGFGKNQIGLFQEIVTPLAHHHLPAPSAIILCHFVPSGIPLFDTPPTFVPLYELITQFELSKEADPVPLNHNMRFYAVSTS